LGIQKTVDYIEAHITEELDYDSIAAEGFSSSYHFQRTFGLLCGFTLGEYIRKRRLSLAGAELAQGECKVIDAALKYGYESPDSFAKAFYKFHGILPSEAKLNGRRLKSFSRLSLNISLEGGSLMDYRLEEKRELVLTGFKTHFTGVDFVENLGLETLVIPGSTYVVFETKDLRNSVSEFFNLIGKRAWILTEWMPEMGLQIKRAPELAVYHWMPRKERRVEVWMPVEKNLPLL